MNLKDLKDLILSNFADLTQVRPLGQEDTIVRLPFRDTEGDPVELSVHIDGNSATIDDAGTIAGLLFSLDQHNEGSPVFTLLQKLVQTHRLEIDFDEGLVRLRVDRENLYDGIAELAKVVITIQTAAPHIREQ